MGRMAPQDHPLRQRKADPHERLIRALLDMAGEGTELLSAATRPWASATFQGSRHEATLRFSGGKADGRASAMAMHVPEAEFAIPGHIVADVSVDSRERFLDGEGQPYALLSLSALVIEDW